MSMHSGRSWNGHMGAVDDSDDIYDADQGLVESQPKLQDGRRPVSLDRLALGWR